MAKKSENKDEKKKAKKVAKAKKEKRAKKIKKGLSTKSKRNSEPYGLCSKKEF